MPVPLLDVVSQNLALQQPLREAFERLLNSGQYILGAEVADFENAAARLVGSKHALGISSGTDAILLALMALDLRPGDEVLCPSFTFFATAGCVARLGGVPVFVDSDPATFNLDPADLPRKITAKTKGVIPVHLFGQCAPMDEIMEFARQHGLWVIEDAAQAFGAKYKGRFAGAMGEFGTYSFFPSKNLGGLGDGGLLVCGNDELEQKARVLRNHGAQPKYFHKWIGGNFRLDALQAACLSAKLPMLPQYNAGRQANAAYYTEHFLQLPGFSLATGQTRSLDTARVLLPSPAEHNDHIWNQYTLRAIGPGRRDALRQHLQSCGIGCEIYYPVPLEAQECFASLRRGPISCRNAALLAEQSLSIPIYPELTSAQRDEVIRAVASFAKPDFHNP